MTEPKGPLNCELASRLRDVRVGLRDDLRTSRHLFGGRPAYVLSDPLTFQSHRFDPDDYRLLISLDSSRSLGEIFADLAVRGEVDAADEEPFYQFVFSLHQIGFLHLPVSDEKRLYRRYQQRREAQRRRRWGSFLFLQIPVWNPDAFLTGTVRYARFMFKPAMLLVWLGLVTAAAVVAAGRWEEFRQPLNGLLVAHNLPLMWVTLVGLKLFHEFGHAFACKHFGVYVPEMGVYLIAGTPCAYVDATGSWGLSRRRQRIVVGLAGMYFESFIAATAVFVWAFADSAWLRAEAYNVVFLASAVTALFNINPLMRYDGYYILSDLLGVPNLRRRSEVYVKSVLARVALGLPVQPPPAGPMVRAVVMAFGLAAPVYRALVIIGIAAVIAGKLFIVGLLIGAGFVTAALFRAVSRLTRFLWYARETAPVRVRAVGLSLVVLAGAPLALAWVPVRRAVYAPAIVRAEHETAVRAEVPGFTRRTLHAEGTWVRAGDVLVELENDAVAEALLGSQSRVESSRAHLDALRAQNAALFNQERVRQGAYQLDYDRWREKLATLLIKAPREGRLVAGLDDRDVGRYVEPGQAVAVLVSGAWQVEALLTAAELDAAAPRESGVVEFRTPAAPRRTYSGVITRIRPAGSPRVDEIALTPDGGGEILVEPETGLARESYFRVVITLSAPGASGEAPHLTAGATGVVRFGARPEPIGLHLFRRISRFTSNLQRG